MKLGSKISELYNQVKVPKKLFHIDFDYLDNKLKALKTIVFLCSVCIFSTMILCIITYIMR